MSSCWQVVALHPTRVTRCQCGYILTLSHTAAKRSVSRAHFKQHAGITCSRGPVQFVPIEMPKSGSASKSKAAGRESQASAVAASSYEELPPLPPAPVEDLPPLPLPPPTSQLQNQPLPAPPSTDPAPLPQLPALPAADAASGHDTPPSPTSQHEVAAKKTELTVSNTTPQPQPAFPLPAVDAATQLPPLPPSFEFPPSLPDPHSFTAAPSSMAHPPPATEVGPTSAHHSPLAAIGSFAAANPASMRNYDGVSQQTSVTSTLSSPIAAGSKQNGANFRLISPDLSSPVAHSAPAKSSLAHDTSSFSSSVGTVLQRFKVEQNDLVQVSLRLWGPISHLTCK